MLNRRQLLAAGAAALHAQVKRPDVVVDVHTHFYDPSRPQGVPWPSKTDSFLYRTVMPKDFRETTRACGDVRTVVVEASPWVDDNQWLLDLAKDEPTIVGVVGNLRPGTQDFRANLKRFAANPMFRGIRVSPAGLLKELSIYKLVDELRALVDLDLTVDVIGGGALYGHTLAIARKLPKLRISMDHLPVPVAADDRQRAEYERDLDALAEFPRVWAKVSGVLRTTDGKLDRNPEGYARLFRVFGPRRLLYASNWPLSNRIVDYKTYLDVLIDTYPSQKPTDIARLLRDNSRDAYKWKRTA